MISQFEKIKSKIEHGELLPMQVFEMMLEARGSTKPFRYGFKYDNGEYSSIIEETREQWLKLNYKGEIVALYDHPPAPAAGVPDDFLQKLGVWYAKLTNCDAVAADDGVHVGYCCPLAMMDEFESLLSAAPTPPSAGQDTCELAELICNHIKHGDDDHKKWLRDELHKFFGDYQNLSNAQVHGDQPNNPHEWILEKLSYHKFERDDLTINECLDYLATEWTKVHGRTTRQLVMQVLALLAGQPSAQRITEQDAREIAKSALKFWRNTINITIESWINNEGKALLAKLNENREPDYKSMADELASLAEKLITEACCNAVAKLNEIAPDKGWDRGEIVAEMYIRRLRAAIAKHEGGK